MPGVVRRLQTDLIVADLSNTAFHISPFAVEANFNYVPTQFFSELVKNQHDSNGIMYKSAMYPEDSSLVIFNSEKYHIENPEFWDITQVRYTPRLRPLS